MAPRIIQIKKTPKPPPKPKRNIIINKPNKSVAPSPVRKHNIIINKPQQTTTTSPGVSARIAPQPKPKVNQTSRTNPARVATRRPATTKPRKRKAKSNPMTKIIPIGIVALVIIILTVIVSKHTRKPTQRIASDYIEQDDTLGDRMRARMALAEVKEWQKDNPEKYDEIIAKFQEIIDKYPNELAAKTAARSILNVEREIQKLIDACMAELTQKCKALIKNKEHEEAIAAFMDYDGEYAAETEENRHANADKIRNLLQKIAAKAEVNVLDQALAILLKDGIEEADVFVILHSKKDDNLLKNQEWQQLIVAINAAKIIPELLIESFKKQIGETITVDLVTGRIKILISNVKNGKIQHSKRVGRANITKEISIDSLSNKEQLIRLKNNLSGIALVKAIEATRQSNFVTAKKYLQLTPSPLKERILNMLDEAQLSKMASIASLQISQSLWMAKIKVTPPNNFKAALTTLESTKLSSGMKLLLYSVAKNVYRYSSELPWYKEADNYALMKYLLGFKPSDEENEDEWQDDSNTDDDNDSAENDEDKSDTENAIDESQIDWRKEIDF